MAIEMTCTTKHGITFTNAYHRLIRAEYEKQGTVTLARLIVGIFQSKALADAGHPPQDTREHWLSSVDVDLAAAIVEGFETALLETPEYESGTQIAD